MQTEINLYVNTKHWGTSYANVRVAHVFLEMVWEHPKYSPEVKR